MTEKAITKEMPIGDVVRDHPETIAVFMKNGLHCIGCAVAAFESIAEGAAAHGIEIDPLVDQLNEAVAAEGSGGSEAAGQSQ